MKNELKFELSSIPFGNEMIIRKGVALEPKEPLKVLITGTINSVSEYLKKRPIDPNQCHVLVDRDKMSVTLIVNEKYYYRDTVVGQIILNPEFTKWGINNDNVLYSSHDLAKKIKMNRYQFASLEKATELVTVFQNLKAKVQKEIESSDNHRGAVKRSVIQVVNEMSIPERFDIITPIFKGDKKRTVPVEIIIDAETMNCSLISPEAIDIVARERDNFIDQEVNAIHDLHPSLAVFEI